MKYNIALILCLFLLMSCGNSEKVNLSEERKKILDLHQKQRDYHFFKDSISFANQMSENFISVNRGEISKPQKKKTISRYHRYFSSVEFLEWDDVSEPIIKFSDDGTMAYTIVDKIVRVAYLNQKGDTVEGKTHFAWTAIYKKYGDEWKIDNVTSTNKPEE